MIDLSEISKHYPGIKGFEKALLREYLQYKILDAIFLSKIAEKLSFLGGTALKIVYGGYRFSEDLDFDNFSLSQKEFTALTGVIKTALENEGYPTEIKNVFKGAFRCYIKIPEILFENELSHMASEKMVIQVDTSAHDFEYQPNVYFLQKFEVARNIRVTPIDIILSQKVAAVFGRKRAKGRDFYDIMQLMSKTDFNFDYLSLKLGIKNKKELRKALLDHCRNIDLKALSRDVRPFLLNSADDRISSFIQYIEQEL